MTALGNNTGQLDINLFGLTYLQRVSDAPTHGAMHVEPGIWVRVPPTTIPPDTKSNNSTIFNQLTVDYLLLDFGGRSATALLAYQMLVAANWQHNFTMQQVIMSVLDNYTSYLGNKGLVAADDACIVAVNLRDIPQAWADSINASDAYPAKNDQCSSPAGVESDG